MSSLPVISSNPCISDTIINPGILQSVKSDTRFRLVYVGPKFPMPLCQLPNTLKLPEFVPILQIPDLLSINVDKNPHKFATALLYKKYYENLPIRFPKKCKRGKNRNRNNKKLVADTKFVSLIKSESGGLCDCPVYYIDPSGVDIFNDCSKAKCDGCIFRNVRELRKLDIYHAIQKVSVLAFGRDSKDDSPNKIICWIASAPQFKQISSDQWLDYREIFELSCRKKYKIPRSERKNLFFESYVCYGYRKDMMGTGIGEYKFLPTVTDEVSEHLTNGISHLVTQIESVSSPFYTNNHSRIFRELVEEQNIPTVTELGWCTQFGIGSRFISSVHIDKDYNFSTLCAYSYHPDVREEDPIYYFNFPTYDITIPIFNGMVLVFDPLIPHSCSNPLFPESFIFSCYVSQKTVNTCIANNEKTSDN